MECMVQDYSTQHLCRYVIVMYNRVDMHECFNSVYIAPAQNSTMSACMHHNTRGYRCMATPIADIIESALKLFGIWYNSYYCANFISKVSIYGLVVFDYYIA